MRTWESTINRLIKEAAQRRASERGFRSIANSTNPRLNGYTPGSLAPGYAPPLSAMSTRSRADSAYGQDYASSATSTLGPSGYPGSNMFEMNDDDEDNFEEYPPASSGYASGRGTPMGSRRPTTSLPPEQREPSAYGSVRAFTEGADGPVMAQWRNNNGLPPSSNGVLRPVTPRVNSNMSAASDASFGPGVRPQQRPPLRSQLSSTKLRAGYDSAGAEANYRQPPRNPLPPHPAAAAMNRSRSASQPVAYIPKGAAPPMPSWNSQSNGSISSMNKRGSGSSQSTGDSSDYSPNSSSPITPFGSSESSLGGIRPSRSQNFDNAINEGPPIKVKVHFHEDIFVIQVPRATEYEDLVEKVGRKIRLCGPRRDDGPLRVKYRDEDGDMVSLGSTEDVQMAFEQFRPGGQVTLFVT
jgi:cell division control protein 24